MPVTRCGDEQRFPRRRNSQGQYRQGSAASQNPGGAWSQYACSEGEHKSSPLLDLQGDMLPHLAIGMKQQWRAQRTFGDVRGGKIPLNAWKLLQEWVCDAPLLASERVASQHVLGHDDRLPSKALRSLLPNRSMENTPARTSRPLGQHSSHLLVVCLEGQINTTFCIPRAINETLSWL